MGRLLAAPQRDYRAAFSREQQTRTIHSGEKSVSSAKEQSKACPGCCDFKSVTEPVWAYLFAAPITLGCVVGTTTPTLGVASWRPAKGCKPAADLSVKLAVARPREVSLKTLLVAELVFQPFESEAVRTTSSLDKLFDVTGYRAGSAAEHLASSDLVLELSGTHALKTTRLRLANQAAASAQIALPVLTSGDRTLLGVARLGDVAVGKLACILDGTAPATIHLLHGTRYLRRTLLFNAQGEMQSSVEVERPELGVETPICWGNAHLRAAIGFGPELALLGLSIQLPQGLTVPQITAFYRGWTGVGNADLQPKLRREGLLDRRFHSRDERGRTQRDVVEVVEDARGRGKLPGRVGSTAARGLPDHF